MPNLAVFHPQIVHFVVALLILGVAFRLIALTGRFTFTGPSATVLILIGTLAAVAAVKSGDDAHGPVEDIPGAGRTLDRHEVAGERTRNVFLLVAALEIAALFGAAAKVRKPLRTASGAIGVIGIALLYQAAQLGGDVVYKYAGGVGTRSGDPADVERLLVAGLYHQARQDRRAGRSEAAARLIEELARRHPDDAAVGLLAAESLILDRGDGRAALEVLSQLTEPDLRFLVLRRGLLTADAYAAAGFRDSARLVLERLETEFPSNQRLRQRIADFN